MRSQSIQDLLKMDKETRENIEVNVATQIAEELFKRLPRTPKDFDSLITSGGKIGAEMGWDAVAKNYILPGLARALAGKGGA